MKKQVLRKRDFQQKNEMKLAKIKSFSVLLMFLLVAVLIGSMIAFFTANRTIVAKPVGPNPGQAFWPTGTTWGTNLRFENTTISEIFWGVGTSNGTAPSPPDPPNAVVVEFLAPDYDISGITYATWVKEAEAEPASYFYQVQFRKAGAAGVVRGGTVSSTMENIDTRFVPQDYSVVLENTDLGIHINLRAGNDNITDGNIRLTPILAGLYVDNAVNIENIKNIDPLTGNPGDNLRLNVFVKNTGRYTDNYTVSVGGSLDPVILNLPPDTTDNVIVTAKYPPSGTDNNIFITAAGTYATDQDYVTATGAALVVRSVQVVITPSSQENDNGGTLKYDVLVKNLGNVLENFQFTRGDNAGWTLALDNTFLVVPSGENRTTKLTVNIPSSATGGTFDSIWVKAASKDNTSVFDNKSCLANVRIVRGVQVVITPPSQENDNGGTLTYTVTVNSLSNVLENFQFTRGDNAGWTLALDNAWLLVPKGGTGATKLTVNIPPSAIPGTFDSVWVKAASKDNALVFDNKSCLAHVKVVAILRGVQVVITPPSQENDNGGTLKYDVLVKNLGNVLETFQLTRGDNAGWTLALDNTSLVVPSGENRTTKLTVNIPTSATGGTIDNVWVRAASQDNSAVFDNESCLAKVRILRGVQVVITPPSQENDNGGTLTYTVTVNSLSNVLENFQFTRGDNAGWTLTLDNAWLLIAKGGTGATKLIVNIPPSAIPGTFDNIWVKAASKDNAAVFDNKSCLAHVKVVAILRGVQVVITPPSQENDNGGTLKYDVLVKNLGNVLETFQLTKGDNAGWTLALDNTSLVVPIGENRTTKLTVNIPSSATGGTIDNVWVRAASQDNSAVFDNESCLAKVRILRGVQVVITPPSQENDNGGTLTYTVTVNSLSNVFENFQLTRGDNAGWTLALDNAWLLIAKGGTGTTKLTVNIPPSAVPGTFDSVWVKAASKDNALVFDNESCLAHVKVVAILRGVQVVITPLSQENDNGGTLKYDVLVKNLGNVFENFQLTRGDNAGWTLTLDNAWLVVPIGENRTTKLTVNIPTSATGGTIDNVWVKAASKDNSAVFDNESCLAKVRILRGVQVVITPPSQENDNGGTLTYTVTVNSLSNVIENFQLTKGDNAGWTLILDNTWLLIAKGGTGTAKLTVNIPASAIGGTFDNVWVKAASKDNTAVFDNKSCLAHVRLAAVASIDVVKTATPPVSKAGDNVVYNIKVTNTGDITLVNITVMDSLLGNLSGSFADNLAPLASENHNFNYTVKGSDPNLLVNTVIVHANPIGMINDITDNAQVSVTLEQPLAEVEVTILPDPLNPDNIAHVTGVTTFIEPCWSYDPLTYAVKVSNKGILDDEYELTVTGPSTWGLMITPDDLFVPAGDAEFASLSITLPDDWTGGLSGVVTVTAVGILSSENQNNLFPTDNDSVTVTSGIENNVAKEIFPGTFEPQTGAPGSPLVWLVVLKNTGNIVENLSLSLSEVLTGVSPESVPRTAWGATFDNTLFENVAPCTDVFTYLRVTIPGDAKTSEWDNITITASDGLGALDIEWVRANVGPVISHPSIDVVKTATPTVSKAGDNVVYNIKVTNTGDITLVNITVMDSLLGNLSGSFADNLAPLASENHNFNYTVKVSDPNLLVNTVIVHANPIGMINDITDNAQASVTLVNENENEPLFVNKAPSTTTTMLSENMILPGDSVTDTVTVTGLPHPPYPLPTGSVIFQVKFNGGAWVTYDNENLVNGTSTSIQLTLFATGQYWFRAIYSGDNNYENSQSPDDNEPLTVFKHDTTTATLLSASTITLGENVTDEVTVTGSFGTPTGSVIFQVKFDGGAWVTYDNENLVNGMATSIEYVPLAAGDYWFRAIYSGDDNYNGSQSLDDSEPLMVNKHNTTTRTQLSASVITLGENVTDNAYVNTGLPNPPYPLPTGTITFQVKFNGGAWVTFDVENLVNGMAISIPYVPLQAGQYYFRAIYSGDNNYNGSQS